MYGVVDRIEVVNKGDPNNIAGTVIGGIIGGLIGHQIGGGTGNTVATIAGAAGGAYAGNQVEKRSRAAHETFRVTVRMDDGSLQTITQENITDLQPGDRVRLDGDRIYRV
jgi:outer membrane lipoprotein SlyB